MPYRQGKNELKKSNVNYVGRDFNDLKKSLINYTKSYFPNTYKDFNETSPGMMLLEMSAYVGDVLNFYIDQQYREMMLPLTEDRRNIINIAKSYGYKTKAISPSYVELTISDTIDADGEGQPDYSNAIIIDKGMNVASSIDTTLIFETLDVVDFTVSSSNDVAPEVSEINTAGVPTSYVLKRKVRAVSGQTKTTTFNINEPEKFLKLTLPETNVIEVLKVNDTNGSIYYEVDSLSQDRIPVEKHYTSDDNRNSGYMDTSTPVPY